MKFAKTFAIMIIASILIQSCSTGESALRRGDYYEATKQAVARLRSNPDSEKAMSTLLKSYPMALDYYRQQIDRVGASNSADKYITIVGMYTKCNELADEISRCPAALDAVKPVVYFDDQLQKATSLAIAEQYNIGVRLLNNNTITDAREAVKKFEWVKERNPGYADLQNKMLEAEDMATLKIVIEPLPYMGDVYQENLKRFYHNFYSDISKNSHKRFVRFFQPNEAEEYKIRPHQVIKMQFVDFSVGNIFEKESTSEYTSDTLVVGQYKDGTGLTHDVMGVVKAKATIHNRNIVSRGILDVKIIDYYSNSVLENKRFPGEYTWHNNWAEYNGDERALPADIKKMLNEKKQMPPPPQDLFILFSDPLGSQAASFVKSYYRNK
ncbi:MAG: hypothetical protein JXA77_02210 [Bacteroidales bacterium]|nr:hypothetical protein [Bacteroidales bacterium]